VKELFISLGFGGSVWTWMQEHLPEPVELDGDWGTYLEDMEDAMEEVRRVLAEQHPEEFKLMSKGKRNPHASLSFHVYAHHEAVALQKMRSACGKAALARARRRCRSRGFAAVSGCLRASCRSPVRGRQGVPD
jgi:hypothetical protein